MYMKKTALFAALVAGALLFPAQKVHAQAIGAIGADIGLDAERDGDLFLGANARIGGLGFPLTLAPSVEFGIGDFDYTRAEANLLYYIGEEYTTTFTPYVGPGAALIFHGGDTDVGINVVGGVEFRAFGPNLTPFAQARYTFQPGVDGVGVMGGVLLRFGAVQ